MTPSQRLVKLLLLLQRRGRTTTAGAAAHLGVTRRRALTDLKQLAEVAPIQRVGDTVDAEWVIDPLRGLPGIAFLDRLALEVGRDAVSFLKGTALGDGLDRAARCAPAPPARLSRHMDRKFRFKLEPSRRMDGLHDVMDAILDGLMRERTLDLTYAARRGHRHYAAFEPLTLVAYRRAIYIFGRQQGEDAVRRLSIDRVRSCEVGDTFDYPTDWRPDEALQPWFGVSSAGAVGPVSVRFDSHVARLVIDRRWHPTAQLEAAPDGGVVLHMTTGGPELVSFILEWGEHAEVLAPAGLRDQIAATLTNAAARYRPTPWNRAR